jgi:hypothetical protein
MIRNHEQLAVVRRQLTLAEDALVSLHERVHEQNARNYATIAESYVDMILNLRAEIDAFLEIGPTAGVPVGANGPVEEPANSNVQSGQTRHA